MAITDRSTAADIQPRVWLLTNGGASGYPGRLLVTRIPDLNANGWYPGVVGGTAGGGLDSGLDAVSWTDGSTQRQRVFYVKGSVIYMLPFDNDVGGTPAAINTLSVVQGYLAQGTDVAAVTFVVSGVRWMVVGAGATLNGQSGYMCVFESFDLGANWWNFCSGSGDRPLPASNHDIVGVIANGSLTPEFYFENTWGSLSRARRLGPQSWTIHEELNVPTFVGPSIIAMPSQASIIPSKITLGVLGVDNRIYTTRILPTDTVATWQQQPALPNGAVPFGSKTALGGTPFHGTTGGNPYDREKIYVMGTDLAVYQQKTHDQSGTWDAAWLGPYWSPSGYTGSIGAVTTTTGDASRQPRVFGAVGYPTYTLQEFAVGSNYTWRDYVKIQWLGTAVGNSGIAVAETASAADNSFGIATGIDRNFPNAWKIRLRSSTDGSNTFDSSDSTISPFTGGAGGTNWYVSDPTVSVSYYPSELLHHALTDVAYPTSGCSYSASTGEENAIGTRISYRRGTSAAAIAALNDYTHGTDAYLIDDVSADILDHPWLVTTTDGSGTTAHVVYWNSGSGATCTTTGCYWRLAPNTPSCQTSADCSAGVTCDTRAHKCALAMNTKIDGPPRAVVGPNNEVYAIGNDNKPGWRNICTLKNAFNGGVQAADCTTPAVTPAPSEGSLVYVGPAISQWPVLQANMSCQLQGGQRYKCFNYYAQRSMAADPVTPYKVYIAYVAASPPQGYGPGIYFTQSNPSGNSFGSFTTPIPIATNPTNLIHYDPEVVVDSDGTVSVLYSSVSTAPGNTSGLAWTNVAISINGGAFTTYQLTNWNASTIQFHCGRGNYFFGDYMHGKTFATRSLLNYPTGGSTSTPYTYTTSWVNRWNVN